MEDRVLNEKLESYKAQPIQADDNFILYSSTDLFVFYMQTLANCSRISIQKPFLDLIKMYQKWLDIYKDILLSKLPREDKKPTDDDIKSTCFIVNTADYCASTTSQVICVDLA